MLGVREIYTNRRGFKEDGEKFDSEDSVRPCGKGDEKSKRILSTVSSGNTVRLTRELDRSEGGNLNLTKGKFMRQLELRDKSNVTEVKDDKTECVGVVNLVSETSLGATKAKAASDMVTKMGDPKQGTDQLIDTLADLKDCSYWY